MKASGKVTVKDISQRLGVSLSTVNKALTGKPGISEKRREEILLAAKEMGYVVNHVAQSLSRKPMKLGVIIPSGWRQYFSPMEEGMGLELQRLMQSNVSGEFVHIDCSANIIPAFERLKEEKVDLIIYCPSLIDMDGAACEYISELRIPIMLAGADCRSVKSVCTVSIDSELSGRMAADFLSVPMRRCGKVAVLMGSKKLDTHISKAVAFVERAAELGLFVTDVCETEDDPDIIAHCVNRIYENNPDVGGIYVATGSVKSAVECFSGMPEAERPFIVATDVCDDVRCAMKRGEVIATVFQNQVLMGRLAIEYAYEYLVKANSYGVSTSTLPKRVYVAPHLFLPSNLDCFGADDGNDYRIEK